VKPKRRRARGTTPWINEEASSFGNFLSISFTALCSMDFHPPGQPCPRESSASDSVCTPASRLLGVLTPQETCHSGFALSQLPAAAFVTWHEQVIVQRSAVTPADDVQRLLSRCRPQFYLMAVSVLLPPFHVPCTATPESCNLLPRHKQSQKTA
ncbi:hypothetical protein MTO96_051627, partial [Rhipicephalus appendiculatus]